MIKDALEWFRLMCSAKQIGNDSRAWFQPQGMEVFNAEDYQPYRQRERFLFATTDIDSFIEYAISTAPIGDMIATIDPETLSATVVLNYREMEHAGHADNVAALDLEKTPVWCALSELNGEWMSQDTLMDFVRDNSSHIKEAPALLNALQHLSAETLRTGSSIATNFERQSTVMERTLAQSRSGELPDQIEMRFAPYFCLSTGEFIVYLNGRVKNGSVVLRLVVKELPLIQYNYSRELIKKLEKGLPIKPYLGVLTKEF